MSGIYAISAMFVKKSFPVYVLNSIVRTTSPLLQTSNTISLKKNGEKLKYASPKMMATTHQSEKSPSEIPTKVPRTPNVPADFDPIPLEKPADPPPISPGPTPGSPSPEFPGPPNPSPPKPEAPVQPVPSPPGQPEVFPPNGARNSFNASEAWTATSHAA